MTATLKPAKAPYPILSIVSAILLLGYFYLQTQPNLIYFYHVPAVVLAHPMPEVLFGLFAALVIIELCNVQRQRRRHCRAGPWIGGDHASARRFAERCASLYPPGSSPPFYLKVLLQETVGVNRRSPAP